MFKRICMLLLVLTAATTAWAEQPNGLELFVEGSYAPYNAGRMGSGGGGAFGIRYKHFGIRIGAADRQDQARLTSDQPPAAPSSTILFDTTSPSFQPYNAGATAQQVQKGQTGFDTGIDFDFYYDVNEYLSAYVSPGVYYHNEETVYQMTDNLSSAVDPVKCQDPGNAQACSGLDITKNRNWIKVQDSSILTPTGSVGVHFKMPLNRQRNAWFTAGAGFHSLRGITLDAGILW